MYINVSKTALPCYQTKRGSSSLEGHHRYAPAALNSANTSPELALAYLQLHLQKWNVIAGIRKRKRPDYGTTNLMQLHGLNKLAADTSQPCPFPDLPAPVTPWDDNEATPPHCQIMDLRNDAKSMAAAATAETLQGWRAAMAGLPPLNIFSSMCICKCLLMHSMEFNFAR